MKKLRYYMGIAMSALALTACGTGSQGTTSNSTQNSSGKTEITYAIWDSGQEPGIRKIADKFEEKNPTIKVKTQVVSWDAYWTMLEAGATGGSLPDTFWMHSNEIYRYASNGMLLDLGEYIAKSDAVDLKNYPQGLNSIYNVNQKQYAVPKDYDTIGLWYNKKMFDEAGLSYPDETWDWDKLKEAAKKLTKADGSQYGFLAPLHNQEGYYNFVYQNGGEIVTKDKKSGYDQPQTIAALDYYFSFVREKISPEITEDDKRIEALQNGQVAMGLFGSWNLATFQKNDYIRQNFDVAVLPKAKDGKRATIFNGLGNAIAANTKNKEAAWKWVEFLSSKEGQQMQAELGVAISAYNGTAQSWVESNKAFNIKHFIDMVDYARIRPYSNATSKWEDKAYELLKPAYLGKESVEQASKNAATMMNNELSSEK